MGYGKCLKKPKRYNEIKKRLIAQDPNSLIQFFVLCIHCCLLQQLCHTCHVARPHRSKHCRVHRKCVLLFDHFCPFVDNSIGLYNYKYFYVFLITTTLGLLGFAISFYIYLKRYTKTHSMPWGFFFLGLELCFCIIPAGGLAIYHTQLSMVNLVRFFFLGCYLY